MSSTLLNVLLLHCLLLRWLVLLGWLRHSHLDREFDGPDLLFALTPRKSCELERCSDWFCWSPSWSPLKRQLLYQEESWLELSLLLVTRQFCELQSWSGRSRWCLPWSTLKRQWLYLEISRPEPLNVVVSRQFCDLEMLPNWSRWSFSWALLRCQLVYLEDSRSERLFFLVTRQLCDSERQSARSRWSLSPSFLKRQISQSNVRSSLSNWSLMWGILLRWFPALAVSSAFSGPVLSPLLHWDGSPVVEISNGPLCWALPRGESSWSELRSDCSDSSPLPSLVQGCCFADEGLSSGFVVPIFSSGWHLASPCWGISQPFPWPGRCRSALTLICLRTFGPSSSLRGTQLFWGGILLEKGLSNE